jgi:hypothetical protein
MIYELQKKVNGEWKGFAMGEFATFADANDHAQQLALLRSLRLEDIRIVKADKLNLEMCHDCKGLLQYQGNQIVCINCGGHYEEKL